MTTLLNVAGLLVLALIIIARLGVALARRARDPKD